MTAMVGKRLCQIKVPRQDAYVESKSCCLINGKASAENKTRPARLINTTTEMVPMLATAMMERTQRTNWPATAP